jgi:hypothetical protein
VSLQERFHEVPMNGNPSKLRTGNGGYLMG